jgi:hypothetical protein
MENWKKGIEFTARIFSTKKIPDPSGFTSDSNTHLQKKQYWIYENFRKQRKAEYF